MWVCKCGCVNVLRVWTFISCSPSYTVSLSQRQISVNAERCMIIWIKLSKPVDDGCLCTQKERWDKRKGQGGERATDIQPSLSSPLRLWVLQITFGQRDESGGTNMWHVAPSTDTGTKPCHKGKEGTGPTLEAWRCCHMTFKGDN